MENVIHFERFKDVTGWTISEIRQYVAEEGWKALQIHLPKKDDDPLVIERLTK